MGTLARARKDLASNLRARTAELEQAAFTRVRAVSEPIPAGDAEYLAGLRDAIAVALNCGLEVLEGRNADAVPIPAPLLVQARLAARVGIGLEVVVRRYTAGHTMLNDAIGKAIAEGSSISTLILPLLLREQGALLDRVFSAVTEEYRLEAIRQERPQDRRTRLVRKLLAGGFVNVAELPYDLDVWHIGVAASGAEVGRAVQALAKALDRRLLLIEPNQGSTWAWFGGHRRIGSDELERAASSLTWPEHALLTIGEPEHGLAGWRLTNRQARTLLPLAQKGMANVIRYADNALLASMMQDDLLVQSMHQLYLAPLEQGRSGDQNLGRTLRAYFAKGRHVSSTAATLKVSRKTVATRLARVEERIGRPLSSCHLEVEAALMLNRLSHASGVDDPM